MSDVPVNSSISNSEATRFLAVVLAVLVAGLALLLLASELVLRAHVAPAEPLLAKLALFRRAQGGDAVFGDSHAYYGINGIPGFTNQAFGGDSVGETVAKLRAFYVDGSGFRVILVIAPEQFLPRAASSQLQVRQVYAAHLLGGTSLPLPHVMLDYFRVRLPRLWWVLLTRGGFETTARLTADGAHLDDGILAVPAQVAIDRAVGLDAERARLLGPLDATPQGRKLIATLAWLRERQARACVVVAPMFDLYAARLAALPGYEAFFRSVRSEAERLGFRHVNDFRNDRPAGDFTDAIHLNAQGARWWSDKLARDCFDLAAFGFARSRDRGAGLALAVIGPRSGLLRPMDGTPGTPSTLGRSVAAAAR